MKIATFYNPPEPDFECNSNEDLTVPDQSLTVREILNNFTRGTMSVPPVETGTDEDINSPFADYDDLVDASNDFNVAVDNLRTVEKAIHSEAQGSNEVHEEGEATE